MIPNEAMDERLRAALDVEPSPEFVARVRTRIASEPAPREGLSAWWLLPAVGVALGAAAAVVFVSRPPAPVHSSAPLIASRQLPPIEVPAAARPPLAKQPLVEQRWEPAREGEPIVEAATPGVGEILIDQREAAAIRRLIAGVRAGRVDFNPLLRSTSLQSAEPAAITQLEIPDIVIAPLPTGSEGARQ